MRIDDLPTPALLLDLDILTRNIERMAAKAAKLGVRLRPHIKTHKCIEIARRQQAAGATGITVSTLAEAAAFSAGGFSDITYAVPLEPGKIVPALALAGELDLGLTVDDLGIAAALGAAASQRKLSVAVWVKVDAGYHRTGVDAAGAEVVELVRFLASAGAALHFAGLLTHAGHAYQAKSPTEIKFIIGEEQRIMGTLVDRLTAAGLKVPAVSIGSTPSLALTQTVSGVDEIRPGNYVFYDRTQLLLGSCTLPDCAVTVLASVVSSQPHLDHAVMDAGALALSHDPGPVHLDPEPNRGVVLTTGDNRALHPSLRVVSVSQEHGIIRGPKPGDVSSLQPGDRLMILPNHSCLTAPLFDNYYIVQSGQVVDQWPVIRTR